MDNKLFTDLENKQPNNTLYFTKLYSWQSPERVWVPRDRAWYVLYSFFFVLIVAIAAILGQYLLIIAIVAFVFLWFIQAAIPPQISEHTITTIGIRTFDQIIKWRDIKHFWFSVKGGTIFLNLDIINIVKDPEHFRRLSLIVHPGEDVTIFDNLIKYVDYGDTKEVSFNLITRLIYGRHVDLSTYLPESGENYIELQQFEEKESPESENTQEEDQK